MKIWVIIETSWCGDYPEAEYPILAYKDEEKARRWVNTKMEGRANLKDQYYPYQSIVNWMNEVIDHGTNLEQQNINHLIGKIVKNHPDLDKKKLERSIGLSNDIMVEDFMIKKTWSVVTINLEE